MTIRISQTSRTCGFKSPALSGSEEKMGREKDCNRTMYSTEAERSRRLFNEPGDRAVVVVETGTAPRTRGQAPEYCFGDSF